MDCNTSPLKRYYLCTQAVAHLFPDNPKITVWEIARTEQPYESRVTSTIPMNYFFFHSFFLLFMRFFFCHMEYISKNRLFQWRNSPSSRHNFLFIFCFHCLIFFLSLRVICFPSHGVYIRVASKHFYDLWEWEWKGRMIPGMIQGAIRGRGRKPERLGSHPRLLSPSEPRIS